MIRVLRDNSLRMPRLAAVTVAVLSAAAAAWADDTGGERNAAASSLLMPIGDLKTLPDTAIAGNRDVRIQGVVTWHDDKSIAVQDETGGVWMTQDLARPQGILPSDHPSFASMVEVGAEVEVVGVPTRENLFSTMLMPRSLRVVGRRPLPPCRPATHDELFSGVTDHLRVEVRGIGRGFRAVEGGRWWMLFVDGRPGEIGVLVPHDAFPNDPTEIVDAEILVRGVSGACYNYRGEFLSPRIHVNGRDDIVVERPTILPPFESPHVPLAELAGYRFAGQTGHRRRIEGVVTFAKSGECFYIQEGGVGVRVETRSTTPLRVGDRVEVAGFVTMERRIAGLEEAVVHQLAMDECPAAIVTTIDGIRERQGRDDGLLVTVPGRLLDVHRIKDGCLLSLVDGGATFEATLHGAEADALASLRPGSDLTVTGIVQAELHYDYRVRPSITRIGLLLRSAAEVVVVRPPSWWTPGRLAQASAVLAVVLLASVGWGLTLRRKVSAQSASLAEEIRKRRDAAVEFTATLRERNRLAANLHDTLLQTLGGIGYQLEACKETGIEGNSLTKRHVDAAHRMVDHALAQLHQSVWALRSLPLRSQKFPEALRSLVSRTAEGSDVRIAMDVQGRFDDVPEFVAGNLLLMVQEGVTNAIRHGHPTAVTVTVREGAAAGMIDVTVADDGRGFVSGTQRGMEQGHFGLLGMRERAERLGGSLTIESEPGKGTTVRACVSRHALDADLA